MEIKCRAETEGKATQSLFHMEIHPIYSYQTRHYCGCQQVFADGSLIYQSPERLCQCLTNTEVDACSHPLDSTGSPMKELEKVHKELKEFAAL